MNLKVTVNVSAKSQANLEGLVGTESLSDAAWGAYNFLRKYHTEFAPRWRGPNWIPSSNSGMFALNVVEGWQTPQISGDTAKIVNTFGLLAWKVTGGTISPRTAKMLTIPLTTAARATSAPGFVGKLFRVGNTLAIRQGLKGIQPQYALAKSVTQAPWPGAMPDYDLISEAAARNVIQNMRRKSKG